MTHPRVQNPKADYRHDIDGLRAIAVLLVVYTHMELPFLTGGFIGVDVFFVLSGFLITQIIYREMQQGEFTFRSFYVRRIRRLLPALVLVLVASLLAFSLILSPQDLQRFTQSILWVLVFIGNFFFWIHHGGYFSDNAKEAPLLHTWSLAIEEQFYFIWPVALLLCIWLIPKRWLPLCLLLGMLVLTWLSELSLNYTIGASYYLLPTRFFELLMGAVLAIGWKYLPMPGRWFSAIGSLAALAVLVYLAFVLDAGSRFPGYNAFYVCAATAVLLYLGQQKHNWVTQLLSTRPMVFFGLISYSLYLWHWPILVWFRYQDIELSAWANVLVFGLMVLCAWGSWRFVELPFRKAAPRSLPKLAGQWFVAPLVLFSGVYLVVSQQQGLPGRFDASVVRIEQALQSHSNVLRGDCHASLRQRSQLPDSGCVFGDITAETTGFLFGDSHANHFTGFLDILGERQGIRIQDYTMDQCPPILGLEWGIQAHRARECRQRNQQAFEHIQQLQPDYVFLAASWPGWNTRNLYRDGQPLTDGELIYQRLLSGLSDTIVQLQNLGIQVVLFQDTAYAGNADPRCTMKSAMFGYQRDCGFSFHPNDMMELLFAELHQKHPKLKLIDVKPFYCKGNRCEAELEGMPLYRDNDHLNHKASELLGHKYLKQFGFMGSGR